MVFLIFSSSSKLKAKVFTELIISLISFILLSSLILFLYLPVAMEFVALTTLPIGLLIEVEIKIPINMEIPKEKIPTKINILSKVLKKITSESL